MWDVPTRWDPGRSHRAITRIDIWSQRKFVASTRDGIVDGTVTEKRASGVRSTLDLTVEPTSEWLTWLALPFVELRPYVGMAWGADEYWIPLGVFPVDQPDLSAPIQQITINAQDRWSLIVADDFTYVQSSYAYVFRPDAERVSTVPISRAVVEMINQTDLGAEVDNRATNLALLTDMMLEKSRDETIRELITSIGAEVFVNRLGQPVIQDRADQPGRALRDGPGGTILNAASATDLSGVINRIGVSTSARDVVFFPQFVEITDTDHPAHWTKIRKRAMRYSSPLLGDPAQAIAMGRSLLAQKSTKALTWTVTCIPDPSRMPSDVTPVTCDLGEFTGVINEIKHPLGNGDQTVVVGAA